jgi:ubiquinone biosynthesis protein
MSPSDGFVEGSESEALPLHVNGKAAGPPPDLAPILIMDRRAARISEAVTEALSHRNGLPRKGNHKATRRSAETQPNGEQRPRRESRNQPILPPDIRKRLQSYFLPQVAPSRMRRGEWKTDHVQMVRRLIVYLWTGLRWLIEVSWDKFRGIDSMERRAVRLRETIESLGGSTVKLGQQLAMRIDLLPYEFSVELSKMLDQMPPFPTEYAIQRIEQFLKRPVHEVFRDFDPVPIGSASVACAYGAWLENGEHVAIKVRRPKIGEVFVADCAALGLVLKALEFLTILRPGLSHNFLYDFRQMLLDELDFSKEVRYTELFRRRARKRIKFVSAPKVYPELSCEDILVTQFMEGLWLRELLNAVEQKDEVALQLAAEKGVYPKLVAKRLLRAGQYGVYENLVFHADPHPSNVVIQRGSRVVFIDFGSCGVYTSRERNIWRQFSYYFQQEDVGRMVQSAIALLEPLPPIDIDELSKRLENLFWEHLNAFKSKHTQWWERTSARVWIKYMELAREYDAPLALNTLRMIRSTLMYETVAARLFPRANVITEHRAYLRTAGKASRRRLRKRFQRFLVKGPHLNDYTTFERMMDMGNRAMYLAQRWLDTPPFHFSLMVDKFVYAVSVMLRTWITFVFFTLGSGFLLLLWHLVRRDAPVPDIWNACLQVLEWGPYQFLIGLNLFLAIRKIMMRLFDKDIKGSSTGLN